MVKLNVVILVKTVPLTLSATLSRYPEVLLFEQNMVVSVHNDPVIVLKLLVFVTVTGLPIKPY